MNKEQIMWPQDLIKSKFKKEQNDLRETRIHIEPELVMLD